MKLLAIDFGMKRIGFAMGNGFLKTAVPIDPIDRISSKQAIGEIKKRIDEYDISKVIMGYPLNMDGTKSKFTIQVDHFLKRLRKALPMEVECVDERLTSFEAEEIIKEHLPDYRKRKKILDSMSAYVILRSYMESLEI